MIGHNDAVVMGYVLEEAFNLIEGKISVDPSSFYNLCNFVEAAILHDHLFLAGFLMEDQHVEFYKEKKIVYHFGSFRQGTDSEANHKLEVYTLFNKAQMMYHMHGGPSTCLDLDSYATRSEGYQDYYRFIKECLKTNNEWWIDGGKCRREWRKISTTLPRALEKSSTYLPLLGFPFTTMRW